MGHKDSRIAPCIDTFYIPWLNTRRKFRRKKPIKHPNAFYREPFSCPKVMNVNLVLKFQPFPCDRRPNFGFRTSDFYDVGLLVFTGPHTSRWLGYVYIYRYIHTYVRILHVYMLRKIIGSSVNGWCRSQSQTFIKPNIYKISVAKNNISYRRDG